MLVLSVNDILLSVTSRS